MMKKILTITLILFFSFQMFGQELDADDRVNITQSTKPFIGVYAFGYQGLPTPGYPQFQLNNYGGVPGTVAATADNSILGMFAFSGHNGTAKKTVGIIRVKSMDNFASALSSRMDFLIGPNREQRMTILGDSGNVGIGTETPAAKLHLQGSSQISRIESTTTDGWLSFYNTTGNVGYIGMFTGTNDMELGTSSANATGDLHIKMAGNIAMTVEPDGDIGVGTQTPENALDVYRSTSATIGITADNAGANAELLLRTNDTANDELFIRKYGASAGGSFTNGVPIANMSVIAAGTGAGPLYTGALGNNPMYLTTNGEVTMYLDADQDVGVGTQAPNAQMHVLEEDGTNTYVIQGESTFTGNSSKYGVYGKSINNPGYGYGGYFRGGRRGIYASAEASTYAGTAYGVQGYATGTAGNRRGVYGQAYNPGGTTAYGLYGTATGAATTNYGVYGNASGAATNWAGYFNGNTYVRDTLAVDDRVHINSDETRNERLVVMEESTGDAVYIRNVNPTATTITSSGYGIEVDAGYRGIDIDLNDADLNGSCHALYISNALGGTNLTGNHYGIRAYASGSRSATGLNLSFYAAEGVTSGLGTSWAGYFAGDVRITGTLDNTSDARLKKNIKDMDNALDIIKQLEPKTYSFRTDEFPHMMLDERPQLGFVAQDMEKVLPQLVRDSYHPEHVNEEGEDSDIPNSPAVDVKSINYIGIIPVLTQGIKELAGEVEAKDEAIEDLTNQVALLEDKISKIENVDALLAQISAVEDKLDNLDVMTIRMEQLEKDLQSCCLSSNAEPKVGGGVTTIELNGNQDAPQLAQNAPNPFNAETSINYYIPASASKAMLTITDMRGAILKTVNLETAGFGRVIVKAGELAPGTYTYTLTVDDRAIETKQMVLIK